jgi:C4-dicarboxylate-specific signal transduction histidine kinase
MVDLLVSALEAMADGAMIRISGVSGNGSLFIEVREMGSGSGAEIRGRLFEPHATASKGAALSCGFSLLWRALIALGGEIWAESSGPDARFTIRLPWEMARRRGRVRLTRLARECAEPAGQPETTPSEAPRARRNRRSS